MMAGRDETHKLPRGWRGIRTVRTTCPLPLKPHDLSGYLSSLGPLTVLLYKQAPGALELC
jgi:hypothetical protein